MYLNQLTLLGSTEERSSSSSSSSESYYAACPGVFSSRLKRSLSTGVFEEPYFLIDEVSIEKLLSS
jgi:hypothetical protein